MASSTSYNYCSVEMFRIEKKPMIDLTEYRKRIKTTWTDALEQIFQHERQHNEKKAIDASHRCSITLQGYCIACGLPHGERCQCLTAAERRAGIRANYRRPQYGHGAGPRSA